MRLQSRVGAVLLSTLAFTSTPMEGLAAGIPKDIYSHKLLERQITPRQRLGIYGRNRHKIAPLSGKVSLRGNVYFITHGWAPGFRERVEKILASGKVPLAWDRSIGFNNGWFEGLCESILNADPKATVFFYSWIDGSATKNAWDAWNSQAYTDDAGIQLSKAIRQVLPPGFSASKVHILGHSHGAKVATVAAININPHPAHLTLFDSPERGPGKAKNKLYLEPYLERLAPSRKPEGTFVDSYYSMFGVCYNNQARPTLKDVVDVRLYAHPCGIHDLSCRHSYPMSFYQRTNASPGPPRPGISWSPLIGGPFHQAKPDYAQAWKNQEDNFLAFDSGETCFGSPDWIETGILPFPLRTLLNYSPLPIKFIVRASLAGFQKTGERRPSNGPGTSASVRLASNRMEDPSTDSFTTIQGDRQIRLDEREFSLVQVAFTKEEGDDAILFDFDFSQPGDSDEFTVWIDDFMLSSLRAPDDGEKEGRVAIGIDDFENGPHALTLALYGVGRQNTAINISNLKRAKIVVDREAPTGPAASN